MNARLRIQSGFSTIELVRPMGTAVDVQVAGGDASD
jgi:hypothetical protein